MNEGLSISTTGKSVGQTAEMAEPLRVAMFLLFINLFHEAALLISLRTTE